MSESAPTPRKRIGCLPIILGVLLAGWIASQFVDSETDPCVQAAAARSIASRSTGDDRTTALMQAEVQQQKCDTKR